MKMLSYEDMKVSTVQSTICPNEIAKLACDHTMLKTVDPTNPTKIGQQLLQFLVNAEHTSILEHCSITFAISGISRSLLAQITCQRMATITSQSQHYQDYTEAPMVVDGGLKNDDMVKYGLSQSMQTYAVLLNEDIPREEARQVLPNAAAVNILWTINARSLMLFLRQRLCKRNVKEMRIFAEKLYNQCYLWWPELFDLAGPPCHGLYGECNQGHMRSDLCK